MNELAYARKQQILNQRDLPERCRYEIYWHVCTLWKTWTATELCHNIKLDTNGVSSTVMGISELVTTIRCFV